MVRRHSGGDMLHRHSCISVGVVLLATAAATPAAAAEPGPTFLQILWRGAELPGAVIVLMSIVAVAIILDHFIAIRGGKLVPAAEVEAARELIESRRFKECIAQLQTRDSLFSATLLAALREGRLGYDGMVQTAEDTAAARMSRMQRRAEYLHVLGNLGPLMGLLGTVLGMIRAFAKMQETQGAYKTEDLAGGISLALVNTFLGLLLAVVALGFFGVCRNRIETMTNLALSTAIDLLDHFRSPSGLPGATLGKPPRVEPDAVPRSGILTPDKPAAATPKSGATTAPAVARDAAGGMQIGGSAAPSPIHQP